MAKKNYLYTVVVYVGGLASHDSRVVYTCSKESDAEKYLHKYLREHPEVCKAYIERAYNTRLKRNQIELEDED